jgi:hypothetical protein
VIVKELGGFGFYRGERKRMRVEEGKRKKDDEGGRRG